MIMKKDDLLRVISKPTAYQYFIRHLDKPGWFDLLNESGILDEIPFNVTDEKENTIQSQPWWAGYYLLKIADKIPEKVTKLLKSIKTNNNWNAIDLCFRITLKLPPDYSKQLLPNIDKWLDSEMFQIGSKYAIDLLDNYINAKDYETAIKMFDMTIKPAKKSGVERRLRSELYYDEEIKNKCLPNLAQNMPEQTLEVIENRLNEIINIEDNVEDDYSYIWRPSIGESDDNSLYGDAKNIYVEMLRDALGVYYEKDDKSAKIKIVKYLEYKYSIYKRTAIYLINTLGISGYYHQTLVNKGYISAPELSREYLELLRNRFGELGIDTQKEILSLIMAGPEKEEGHTQIKQWTERRLYKIGDIALNDEKLNEYHEFINKYKPEIDAIEKEIGIGTGRHWEGPTSPKTIEEIRKMTPEEFIKYIKKGFNPTGAYWQPTPEGLGRMLGTVVKENPGPYAAIAEKFDDGEIYPAYVSNLLRALHDAWREKKDFEWDSVLKLCSTMLTREDVRNEKDRKDAFDFGRYSWTRGAVADLLGEAVRTDEHVIDNKYLKKIKEILFYIAEKDTDPEGLVATPRLMEHQGKTTIFVDYVSEAINCNRGKALEAVILYALRIARKNADKEAEKGKGPFPAGQRLDEDVKEFLEKRMVDEMSPAVHSTFGRYFQYLYYLDQEWLKEKVAQGLLFPKESAKSDFWEADWQGFIMSNRFYDDIYKLLKPNFKIAIERTKEGNKGRESLEDKRIGEHIMIAYIRKIEELKGQDSLVDYFFNKASSEVRSNAIWFIGSLYRKEKPDTETWKRLKALWEYRAEKEQDEEMGSFVEWLEWVPESIKELYPLIIKSVKAKGKVYHQDEFYEFIIKNINSYPKESLLLANELLRSSHKNKRLYYGYQKSMKTILDAVKPKAEEYKDVINLIVNFLGEIGDYSFREYLVK